MQLEVKVLSIEGMFRRGMEMELEWNKFLDFIGLIRQFEKTTHCFHKSCDDSILLVINQNIILNSLIGRNF